MSTPLRALLVEDSEDDAALLIEELRNNQYEPISERVHSAAEMRAALTTRDWDIVFCDNSMPGFDSVEALRLFHEVGVDLPIVIVSGTITEATAGTALKLGATDYLMKGRLARLGAAVRQALERVRLRREQLRAEAALGESEARLRVFTENIPAITFIKDLAGRYLHVNRRFEQMFRLQREQVIGKTDAEIFSPEQAAAFRKNDSQVLQSGNAIEYEEMAQHFDVPHCSIVSKFPLRDSEGRISGLCGIVTDITERRIAEEALRREQALFTELANTTPDHIYFKDRQSCFIRINGALARSFGLLNAADAVGKTDFDVFSEEHARKAYADEQRIMETGEPIVGVEEKETWPDGRTTWVSTTKVPLRDPQGRITGLVGISRDITESKLAEIRLREQNEILSNSHEGTMIVGLDGKISLWNRGAEEIAGWTESEVLGRDPVDVFDLDRDLVSKIRVSVVKDGFWKGELHAKASNGRKLIIEFSITLVRDEAGLPRARLNTFNDITERKQLEEQFLRAQRLDNLGMLGAGIAHDFNNALAPILMAGPLLRSYVNDASALRIIDMVESSSKRGAALVRQLLSFAHGTGAENQLVQVSHVLLEVVDLAKSTFPKLIQVESHVPSDLWTVQGNQTQIHQVFLNLCVNARDAMAKGGVLTITAANRRLGAIAAGKIAEARQGAFLTVEVRDNGTGIPPEILAKIWEPFFTSKGEDKGTGLGLSTVRGILRNHGGFVNVQTQVGHGTSFIVYLPATEIAKMDETEERGVRPKRGEGELILIVDDEELVRELAARILTEYGYQVVTARDGADAIMIFMPRAAEVRLLLTDVQMPVLGGRVLAGALRRLYPGLAVCAMSGAESQGSERNIDFTTSFLAKPFTAETLLSVVRRALDEPQLGASGGRTVTRG